MICGEEVGRKQEQEPSSRIGSDALMVLCLVLYVKLETTHSFACSCSSPPAFVPHRKTPFNPKPPSSLVRLRVLPLRNETSKLRGCESESAMDREWSESGGDETKPHHL